MVNSQSSHWSNFGMSWTPDTTLDDVLENPNKFGAPTFEEFKRNREKYLGREDDKLAFADRGSTILRRDIKKHIYEIEGYRCKTLEEVERVASSQGIPLKQLDYKPELIQCGAGKYDVIVKFVPDKERSKRESWHG